ncbi:MAG: hypothetical protein NT166_10570 [Candidatus Aminicenantes bacterium]|nr:hypothetical protein [Candidatus Aminicenantes bacterium]
MRKYMAIFLDEGGRFLSPRFLSLVILAYTAALLLVYSNTGDYRDTVSHGDNFRSVCRLKFEKMGNYNNYSLIGIKSLFVPAPLSVLYNSIGAAKDWKGRVDTIAALEIDKGAKGNKAFEEEAPFSPFRYAYIILIAGGLLSVLYGITTLRNIEYDRFLSGYLRPGQLFTGVVLSRVIFITLSLAGLSGIVLLLLSYKGIQLSSPELKAFTAHIIAGWALMMFFFFSGLLIGRIRSTSRAWTTALIYWSVLALLLPASYAAVVNNNAAKITDSDKVELDQLTIINDFENKSEHDLGKFNRNKIEEFKIKAEGYWNNDYKSVEKVEIDLREEVARHMKKYRDFSIWNPITFYLSVSKDVGGKGPDNYLGYNDFLIALKRNFLRFFIDRCFYFNPLEMVNFIKADENIYYAVSRVPGNFGWGLLITFMHILLFLFLSYWFFKKALYRMEKEAAAGRESAEIRLKDHEVNACVIEGEGFRDFLYALLSDRPDVIRKTGFMGSVWVDETEILGQANGQKGNQPPAAAYMPRPGELPGELKARNLATFVCRLAGASAAEKEAILNSPAIKDAGNRPFKRLKPRQVFQAMLLLAPLKKSRYYLFHDMAQGLTTDYAAELMDLMERLQAGGSVVIFLTTSASILEAPIEKGCWFSGGEAWTYRVKAFQQAQKSKKKG